MDEEYLNGEWGKENLIYINGVDLDPKSILYRKD